MKTAFLFPGQGSQTQGMLHTLPSDNDYVRDVFAEAEAVLGASAYTLDSAEKLSSTVYTQICLLLTGVISGRRLLAAGVKPDFVAGHSIGAFAAAVISEVLSFKQALQLVYIRGKLMQEAFPNGYGMAALVGFTEGRLWNYLKEHNKAHNPVCLANINAADQMVVAGKTASLAILIRSLQEAGLRKAKMLDMSVPSHCNLLHGVSEALHRELLLQSLQEPRIPYMSNHTGRLLNTVGEISRDLWRSVAMTVRWYDGTSLLYELGTRIFIEMEPAGVLSKIAQSSFPDARVLAMRKDSLDAITWLWNSYLEE